MQLRMIWKTDLQTAAVVCRDSNGIQHVCSEKSTTKKCGNQVIHERMADLPWRKKKLHKINQVTGKL